MKTLTFFLLLGSVILCFSGFCQAGSNQLYVINSCPRDDGGRNFPVVMYKVDINSSKVEFVTEINSQNEGARFVRPYYDKRLVIISQPRDQGIRNFSFISMDHPDSVTKFSIKYAPAIFSFDSKLLYVPDRGLYQSLQVGDPRKEIHKLVGVNLATLNQEELPLEAIKHLKLSGHPGAAAGGGDGFSLYVGAEHRLRLATPAPNGDRRLDSNWELDPNIEISGTDRLWLYVNNDSFMALSEENSRFEKSDGTELGYTTFHLFDKMNQKWISTQFPGGKTNVRGFGSWLAIHVRGGIRNTTSPGIEKRKQQDKLMDITFDYRTHLTYYPGILILYHVPTQRQLTIETHQGDSEILLVHENTCYYRVADKIYQATIPDKGDQLQDTTLLVQDEVVRDIHWAFMGPDSNE